VPSRSAKEMEDTCSKFVLPVHVVFPIINLTVVSKNVIS
jgi:hypothetical protein